MNDSRTQEAKDRVILSTSTTLDMSGAYHIKYYQNKWWVVGHGVATECGVQYSTAKRVLEGMTEWSTVYTPDMRNEDLNAFGRGLADI